MAKGAKGKSSASSGTRKKQAAKAAAKAGGEPPVPKQQQRGQKKDKKDKKAPKKKQYIPPPKPPQPPPDPLDSMGIAALLPAQLTVTLRKAGKKDVITRVRALEQLLAWIEGRDGDEEGSEVLGEEEREAALVTMLPVWVSHAALPVPPCFRLMQISLST